ncbi:MAG TPA: hypothetical protein VKA41_08640 [Solirubrobacterales bacterium]|nr:hypothetical protein [Solirubrobacterales bacterium]
MTTLVAALSAAALLAALAGCGSDESGQDTNPTAPAVSIPSPTSPIPTTTTTPTAGGGEDKKKPAQTTTTTGGSAPCSVPDAYQDFKFTGIDCAAAVALATEWDRNAKDCNTVDNPNVDEGYNRTCEVEAFTCTAKRDVKSDARFVNCSQGGQTVRFTWLPA